MTSQSFLQKLIRNPKRLFLIDSLGALLTLFFLLAILRPLEHLFGMPQHILLALSIPASVFAIYSACCFWFAGTRWRPLMTIVSGANLLYCCVTAGVLVTYHAQLTALGIAYFALEIAVVCALVLIERRAIAQWVR